MLKVHLQWNAKVYFDETIELDDDTVAAIAADGEDTEDPYGIFLWLAVSTDKLNSFHPFAGDAPAFHNGEILAS